MTTSPRKRFNWWFAFIGMLMLVMAYSGWRLIDSQRREEQLWQNICLIQLQIERFAVDKQGRYPTSMAELKEWYELFEIPLNPYTGEVMNEVTGSGQPQTGNYTYFSVHPVGAEADKKEGATGYYLVGYSPRKRQSEIQLWMPRPVVEDARAFVARRCSFEMLKRLFCPPGILCS